MCELRSVQMVKAKSMRATGGNDAQGVPILGAELPTPKRLWSEVHVYTSAAAADQTALHSTGTCLMHAWIEHSQDWN